MSVTVPKGFRAAGVAAGIKSNNAKDVALVVNDGPVYESAGVFTSNRVKAAPVIWSQAISPNGSLHAVVLNSGGANACTGPSGYADTVTTAEKVAMLTGCRPEEVAVCSTGLIGERLPMVSLLNGVEAATSALSDSVESGLDAALAIITTDTVAKTSVVETQGFAVGGMAKGAGMLAPGLATMLVVITTDADIPSVKLQETLSRATAKTMDRIDSDGCMSTNDTVLLLSSGASGIKPDQRIFDGAIERVCMELSMALLDDAEGSTKTVTIDVAGAPSEKEALEVGRAISRSNLLKCAIHGEDPNWGRVLAAAGTTSVEFDPNCVSVSINDVWVCRNGEIGEDRATVDMKGRDINITIDLAMGSDEARVWTNDLTAAYVHENSAYST